MLVESHCRRPTSLHRSEHIENPRHKKRPVTSRPVTVCEYRMWHRHSECCAILGALIGHQLVGR